MFVPLPVFTLLLYLLVTRNDRLPLGPMAYACYAVTIAIDIFLSIIVMGWGK